MSLSDLSPDSLWWTRHQTHHRQWMVPTYPEEVACNCLHHKLQLSTSWCEFCGMLCWLPEDWDYSNMYQVRSYLCQTTGPAMTQLLLRYNTTVTGVSLFPSKSNWLFYHQFREFMGLQEVIAISQVHLSSSALLIHSARARGAGTAQCAGMFRVSPMLRFIISEKKKRYWQPPPYSPLTLSYLGAISLLPFDLQLLLKEGDRNGMAKESSQNHTTISYRKITTGHFSSISTPTSKASLPAFLWGGRGRSDSILWQSWGFHKVPMQVLNFWVISNLVKLAG